MNARSYQYHDEHPIKKLTKNVVYIVNDNTKSALRMMTLGKQENKITH